MADRKQFRNVALSLEDHARLRQMAKAENRSITGQLTYMIWKAHDSFSQEISSVGQSSSDRAREA